MSGIDTPSAPNHPSAAATKVVFDRRELSAILSLYSRRVADGEWRDYAMTFTHDAAIFVIHRRASEYPLYRIEKRPSLHRRQGAYAVITSAGYILRRGHNLIRVLRVLDRDLLPAAE